MGVPRTLARQDMNRKTCGKFPKFCYRAFDCEDLARKFVNEGTFRMRCLHFFKEGDNARRDPTEGRGHIKQPGMVTTLWVSPNPSDKTIFTREPGPVERHSEPGSNAKFCLCTCLPEVNLGHMRKTFGKHGEPAVIVRIDDPVQLAEDIHDYYVNKGVRMLIEGCRVVYNKGQKVDRVLTNNEMVDLAYKQKPENFSPDCEFRFVAIKFGESCPEECKFVGGQESKCKFEECQTVALGRPLKYLVVMELE